MCICIGEKTRKNQVLWNVGIVQLKVRCGNISLKIARVSILIFFLKSLQSITIHTFVLFAGIKGSKYWKRYLNKIKFMKGEVDDIILNGVENIYE